MIHAVKDLTPEQRTMIERLLGRGVAEDETLSIKSVRPPVITEPDLSPEARAAARERMDKYFAKIDSQRKPVSEEEEEEIINEALRSTRPGYRPVR